MVFEFKYSLLDVEKKEITEFLYSLNFFAFEQHPDWPEILDESCKYCFLIIKEKEEIKGYAQIGERKGILIKTAHILFGPICKESHVTIESIGKLHDYYKEKKFGKLSIQLAIPTGALTDYIEYKLNSRLKINYLYDRENWSSIAIDLNIPIEAIFKKFSKGHKSDIKRAEKIGLSINKASISADEIQQLGNVFNKMNNARNILVPDSKIFLLLENLIKFFDRQNRGKFYLVKDSTGIVVGGIIVLFQGKAVRYFKGASDPQRRDLPILHIAIWEAIKDASNEGFECFDFWGYNHMVTEADQIFYINKFKKGFGGEFSFYPKIMHFNYKPLTFMFYNWLVKVKSKIRNYAKLYI